MVSSAAHGALRHVAWAVTVSVLLAHSHPAAAERLPVHTYTTADGLAHDRVKRIVWDPHGFLWLCTPQGLTRFDGSRFVTYRTDDGLPFPSLNDLLITREGTYWLASNGGGVIRFDVLPQPQAIASSHADRSDPDSHVLSSGVVSRFHAVAVSDEAPANRVNVLLEDHGGRVWAGTDGGLFLLESRGGQVRFSRVDRIGLEPDVAVQVWALLEDAEGSIWIGSTAGLARLLPNGRVVHYVLPVGREAHRLGENRQRASQPVNVWALTRDPEGRLWVGHSRGLTVLMAQPSASLMVQHPPITLRLTNVKWSSSASLLALPSASGNGRTFSYEDGLPPGDVRAVFQARDGRLWAAGMGGLSEFANRHFRRYAPANGLPRSELIAMTEDAGGNLWLGSMRNGVARLAQGGFTGFGGADGVGEIVTALLETRTGDLFAQPRGGFLTRFDGTHFREVLPEFRRESHPLTGTTAVIQDHAGEWWIATRAGLLRYAKADRPEALGSRSPLRAYTTRDGLAGHYITHLFEDSRGDIWMGTFQPGRDVLTRWVRSRDRFVRYSDADGLPAFHAPRAFQEDGAGNVWVGFRDGGLARYRAGRFDMFATGDTARPGSVFALRSDGGGSLWVGGDNGLWRVDSPNADRPRVLPYATAGDLRRRAIYSIVEDAQGRLYLGLTSGMDRLEPLTGRTEHYTTGDGLVADETRLGYRDRHGAIWLGGLGGVARLVPGSDGLVLPPRVALASLEVRDRAFPVSALGEESVSLGMLRQGENQLTISFFGQTWAPGDLLMYQYKLEGADRGWGEPSPSRSVRYARLAPGDYRFVVRAIDSRGQVSPAPAFATFTVLSPVWLRWWFLLLAVGLTTLLIHATYRRRLSRIVELERLRTRIATDLHDELGSTLSQIAILSEVARQRTAVPGEVTDSLARIAVASRESIDSMSDIVWAIDPQRDSAQDLAYRMRRLASDLLAPRNIAFAFAAPDSVGDLALDAELRHDVYLIFKETLNNLVRHSRCTTASIGLATGDRILVLSVRDNGQGFDPGDDVHGLGLRSMRERARKIGGSLEVASARGQGTSVTLRVPFRHRLSA
jgi:ligand-binding sensor domain-containing protein/two-component sensor histidine kinase